MKTTLIMTALTVSLVTFAHAGEQDVPGGSDSDRCSAGENLLRNPEFAPNAAGSPSPWSASQHAGEKSFELTLAENTAKIEKIASQPWFTLNQTVPVKPLRGHSMLYRAELKLNLTEKGVTHGFKVGGGLTVNLRGDLDPMIGSDRLLLSQQFEHEPHLGTTDWTQVSMRFAVPDNATRLRVGVAQYANGSMQIRAPALYDCGQ